MSIAAQRQVHVIAPGDHYSPSTGSAIPTVVHGLCRYRPADAPRPAVAVAKGTYPDRYGSAEIREYDPVPPLRLRRPLTERRLDAALGAIGLPRWSARRRWAPAISDQTTWEPSVVLAHNAPQLVPSSTARATSQSCTRTVSSCGVTVSWRLGGCSERSSDAVKARGEVGRSTSCSSDE